MSERSCCELCGSVADYIDKHHISYSPEETIAVCRSCHSDIHHTNQHPELTPKETELTQFYEEADIHVDLSRVPDRDRWTKQIKYIPCNNDDCSNCPHGPYYYYYKREGDGVTCEYGGKVTDEMIADQRQLTEFTA